jgi:dTDP-4-amino-4,6-dideoxygalactose transaminase
MKLVPFSRPSFAGKEIDYLREAISNGNIGIDESFARRCEGAIAAETGVPRVHLTHSATAAIEVAALILDLRPGDEVIIPAFAFVTCANAVALRGAIPVLVDIREDTLNIDLEAAAAAITGRTRAILAVHYAGVPCDVDRLRLLADEKGLAVIEDAAQAFRSSLRGRPAGSFGHLGIYSFHQTKNLTSGEGGAILINDPIHEARAAIHLHKGTDRAAFDRGERSHYSWIDLGSSFTPNELAAAVLLAQLERADEITSNRRAIWARYHEALAQLEDAGNARRPVVPQEVTHNGHCYYLLLPDEASRDRFIAEMRARGIVTPFHFLSLDRSPGGRRYARAEGSLSIAHMAADCIVRLPLWFGMEAPVQDRVIEAIFEVLA